MHGHYGGISWLCGSNAPTPKHTPAENPSTFRFIYSKKLQLSGTETLNAIRKKQFLERERNANKDVQDIA